MGLINLHWGFILSPKEFASGDFTCLYNPPCVSLSPVFCMKFSQTAQKQIKD